MAIRAGNKTFNVFNDRWGHGKYSCATLILSLSKIWQLSSPRIYRWVNAFFNIFFGQVLFGKTIKNQTNLMKIALNDALQRQNVSRFMFYWFVLFSQFLYSH